MCIIRGTFRGKFVDAQNGGEICEISPNLKGDLYNLL